MSDPRQPFTFAGFQFPRAVAILPKGKPAARLAKRRASPPMTGPYTHAPTPNAGGAFFYLDSDFAPGLRWQWADDVDGASIGHTGWWTDPYGDGDSIRGIVLRLPRGRGFLAGWSMGESMASELETATVYDDETGAANAADSLAESVAEREREYQSAWQAGSKWAALGGEVQDARRAALAILRDRKSAKGSATLCEVIRQRVDGLLEEIRDAREKRAALADGDGGEYLSFWPGEERLRAAFNEGAGATVLA